MRKLSSKLELQDCLIIHLERSLERKPQVKKLKKNLPYRTKVVDAVDGSKPDNGFSKSYTPRLLRPRYPFRLRSAEVACFQSHRKCWQEILDRGLKAALIIEDDVDIIDEEFTAAVNLAMEEIKMGDLIRFPMKPREKPRNKSVKRNNISIFDNFRNEKSRNLGIRIVTRNYNKTYTDSESGEILDMIVKKVQSKYSIKLNTNDDNAT